MANFKRFFSAAPAAFCLMLSGAGAVQADDLENLIRLQAPQYAPVGESGGGSRQMSRSDADDLIGSAMGLLGVAYRYGGSSARTGFDCSGFMQHIFSRSMQISLP
uniref:NlpC/P60 family protein n=1 Tax=Neisseria dentiae TaxID=194197 RepID=UPI0035A1526D